VTNTPTAPVFPPGRYGWRREGGRRRLWVPVLLLVVLVLAALALVGRLYGRYGDPAYQTQVTRTDPVTDSAVTVTFTVRKHDPAPAVCQLQAKDRSGAEVGYAEVTVGAGTPVTVTYPLPTRARPYAVDVLRCRRA
jgi:hypothetical protein